MNEPPMMLGAGSINAWQRTSPALPVGLSGIFTGCRYNHLYRKLFS